MGRIWGVEGKRLECSIPTLSRDVEVAREREHRGKERRQPMGDRALT